MGCAVQRQELAGLGDSLLPTGPIQFPAISLPAFAVDPTLLLIGGGVLFLALFLRKGEPVRKRKRAVREQKQARIQSLRQQLAAEGGGGYF